MDVSVTTDVSSGMARASANGRPAGRLGFLVQQDGDSQVWTMYTTVVPSEFNGHGVGSALVRDVVEKADKANARVDPTCWFVAGWLDRHPEYQHLVEDDLR